MDSEALRAELEESGVLPEEVETNWADLDDLLLDEE
jgi:hypothetical protein